MEAAHASHVFRQTVFEKGLDAKAVQKDTCLGGGKVLPVALGSATDRTHQAPYGSTIEVQGCRSAEVLGDPAASPLMVRHPVDEKDDMLRFFLE
jgi:hypothetical protein